MDLDFLKLKRQEANKTQAEVAGALKIGPQAYAKIESGENNLHPKHWKTIKSLLNVTQNELTDFTAAVAVARRQKKLGEDTEAFAADWKLDAEGLDAVNQAVLRALKELPLVDRCRLLAFADDLKNASMAAKQTTARKLVCPICRAELPGDWEVGVTHECPSCGQHIRLK